MTSEEAVVRNVLEAWATRDPETMVALFAQDGVYDNVPESSPLEGHDAIRAWLEMVFEHCWVDAEILNIACNGEWVLTERLDAHVLGDKRLVLPVMNATRVVDGKVIVWRDYYDRKTCDELGLSADAL